MPATCSRRSSPVRASLFELIGTSHPRPASGLSVARSQPNAFRYGDLTFIQVGASGKIPKIPGPAINYQYTFVLDADGNVVGRWGGHDPFPAHGASMQVGAEGTKTLWDHGPGLWGGWGLLPFSPFVTIDSLMEGAESVSIDGVKIK